MADRNPCWKCGFYDCDYGCTADPYQPWTVPEECYLYDEKVVAEMEEFYGLQESEQHG